MPSPSVHLRYRWGSRGRDGRPEARALRGQPAALPGALGCPFRRRALICSERESSVGFGGAGVLVPSALVFKALQSDRGKGACSPRQLRSRPVDAGARTKAFA